ncbi:TOBE domain-containing protein [Frankia sp. AgKG'84/4]|uniref:TOBE domain-containing protein n=1 Tax=Frankia sp. AgKG'84/4 TaxID=573490 RepID=UPI00200D7944|nr:TOBE domain-containing protein [Frankia sp. AgKG'84/4]MCL9793900.1 TOBE domain-containing protein [Frankia sp. AgKG'84/4]
MSLSIRNRLSGTVADITTGAVMSTVSVALAGGQTITAAVTADAVKDLRLAIGSPVEVLVKSSEVALALGQISGISIRNQLRGTVSSLDSGGAMAVAHVSLDGGGELTSAITLAAATDLGLRAGLPVTALVKSTEVALSTV